MLISQKKMSRMAEQHWFHCENLLDLLAFIVCSDNKSVVSFFCLFVFCYPHSLNLDTCDLLCFPIHWFVFAHHF